MKREEARERGRMLTLNAFNAISDKLLLNILLVECRNVQIFLGSRWDHATLSLTASNPRCIFKWSWSSDSTLAFLAKLRKKITLRDRQKSRWDKKTTNTKIRFWFWQMKAVKVSENRHVCKLMLNNVYKFPYNIFRASFSLFVPLIPLSADFIVLMNRI